MSEEEVKDPVRLTDIELSEAFLALAKARAEIAKLEERILHEVTLRGKTIKEAGITATFHKASSGTPDYEEAALQEIERRKAEGEIFHLDPFITTKESVSWKLVCEALKVTAKSGPVKPAYTTIG